VDSVPESCATDATEMIDNHSADCVHTIHRSCARNHSISTTTTSQLLIFPALNNATKKEVCNTFKEENTKEEPKGWYFS